jgi:tRNA U34 5-methylaminomethyl-2-thiouridine-forming methyltransferase MnmC
MTCERSIPTRIKRSIPQPAGAADFDPAMPTPPYLVNEHYDDRYFDIVNAVEEAKHIFFEGTGLFNMLAKSSELSIGETGFGAGRLLIALMDYIDNSGLTGIEITYNSVELHPVTSERMASILEGFRTPVGHLIDQLVQAYSGVDTTRPGWRRIKLTRPFGKLILNLYIGEALEMVKALATPCDVWFLDGHGPKKNPDIWRPELLIAIGEKTVTGGACATFTVAGAVRRALTAAGFRVEQRPGFGGKKAVLKGVKNPE